MTLLWIVATLAFVAFQVQRWHRATPTVAAPVPAWKPPPDAPLVSFLVPSWNGGPNVEAFVKSFGSLSYPNKELVLAVGGDDGSLAAARACAGQSVVVLEQRAGEGKQASLQRCLEASHGSILYLSDIDCRPSDDAVHALLAELIEDRADAVTGPSRPLDAQLDDAFVRVQWAVERATQPATPSTTQGLLGRNAAVGRDALLAARAFTVEVPSGTDYTLAKELLRSGTTITFVPGAPMPTEYPEQWRTYVRKQARWIRNVATLAPKYGEVSEQRAAAVTIALPFAIGALLLLGSAGLGAALVIASFALVYTAVTRYVALHAASLDASVEAILLHLIADLSAAALAGFHIATGARPW